jgi:hypothetical protein
LLDFAVIVSLYTFPSPSILVYAALLSVTTPPSASPHDVKAKAITAISVIALIALSFAIAKLMQLVFKFFIMKLLSAAPL